jgi:hypothetical protein
MLANAADRSELLASMRNAPNNGQLGQSEIWQILAKWIFMAIPPTGRVDHRVIISEIGGSDGTRTRDLLRDRQEF